ncbi:TonB-dependent receptor [Gluconacetobacter azotocaptans DSM 13594]|nr:TonB-dependent receptor [Gluconacetobacter azotocaptans DSM 13594]
MLMKKEFGVMVPLSISRLILLSTTVLSIAGAMPAARAATAAAPVASQPDAAHGKGTAKTVAKPASKPGPAPSAEDDSTIDGSGSAEDVAVTGLTHRSAGGGLLAISNSVKSSVASTRAYIQTQPATTNPQRLIAMQPGAVVASQDPYGVQPGGITVRGLNNNEIIWLFEDSPITNDGTFYPNEAVDALNLEEVRLSPGSTNFDVPGSNGAAGTIRMALHDPSHKMGGMVNVTYGSYDTRQVFGRFETGDIGHTGLRAFVSYSNFLGNDWRGPGNTWRQHVDSKIIKDWHNGSQTALSVEWTDLNFQLERPPTMAAWNTYGKNYNYTSTFTPGDTNYYKLHQNVYEGMFATLNNKIILRHNLMLNVAPYVYYARAAAPGAVNLSPTSAYTGTQKIEGLQLETQNGPTANSATLYSGSPALFLRSGINASLAWDIDRHNRFIFGDWYAFTEQSSFGQFNYLNASGSPESLWGARSSAVYLPNGKIYSFADVLNRVQTDQIFLGDRMNYLDHRLSLEFGFKYLFYRAQNFNRIPGVTYNTNNNQTAPMPSLGARYDFNSHHEVFLDAGVNSRVPDPSQIADSVSATTGKITGRASRDQKIENSIIEELGYRYNDNYLTAQATLFNYNFTNRQVSTVVNQNNTLVTQYVNAGGQTSRGADVSVGSRPFHHFSLFLSGEYLHATIDNNVPRQGTYLPTAGKTATGSPTWTGNVSLSYDDSKFFGNIQMHYVSGQYATFMNDEKLPGYKTVDMSLGYRFPNVGPVKAPKLQLNLVNLTNNHYLAGIYSTQFNAKTTRAVNGTMVSGSAPLYIVGSGFAAMFSVSAAL